MLTITLIAVGKMKERFFVDACAEYEKRLRAYCQFRLIELPEQRTRAQEAEQVRAKIPKGAWLCAFTPEGKKLSSEGFAALIDAKQAGGVSNLCFLIGSSEGIDEELKKSADFQLSVSDMTFPHHLFRVIACEQIYRAMSILAGAKYHK
jgi:23S rRNA (pseudouridine1915-N3)-methyltransferase